MGGNVALDAARTAKRKGASEVTIIYRRSKNEMPAEEKEVKAAQDDDVKFIFNTNVSKIIGDNHVQSVECIKTKVLEKDVINIEDTNYILSTDYVITAVGLKTEEEIVNNLNLELDEKGYIKVDKKNRTSREKVFAGGDLVGEIKTVAWASRSGRNAAENIKKFILETNNVLV